MIGNGAVAEVVLSAGVANNFFSINIAYGLAVAFGIYISAGISDKLRTNLNFLRRRKFPHLLVSRGEKGERKSVFFRETTLIFSGGHLNPAISVAFCCLGRLQWRRLPAYLGAQYLGCLCGSALVFGIYYDALTTLDGGRRITDPAIANATAGIWASYPQPHISWQNGFVDQVNFAHFTMFYA